MNWQDWLALAAVAAAALYLFRGVFKKRSASAPPCGSACGGCEVPTNDGPKVVSLARGVRGK